MCVCGCLLCELLDIGVEPIFGDGGGSEAVAFFPDLSADAGKGTDGGAGLGGIARVKERRARAIAAMGLIGTDLTDRIFKTSEVADLLNLLSLPDRLEALGAEVSKGRDQVHAGVDLAVAADDDTGTACAAHRTVGGDVAGFKLFGKGRVAFGHQVIEIGEFVGLDLHGQWVAFAVVGGCDLKVDDKTRTHPFRECACGDQLAEIFLHLQEFDFGFEADAAEVLEAIDGFLPRASDLGDGIVGGGFCGIQCDGNSVQTGLFELLGAFEVAGSSRGKQGDRKAVMTGVSDNLVDVGTQERFTACEGDAGGSECCELIEGVFDFGEGEFCAGIFHEVALLAMEVTAFGEGKENAGRYGVSRDAFLKSLTDGCCGGGHLGSLRTVVHFVGQLARRGRVLCAEGNG